MSVMQAFSVALVIWYALIVVAVFALRRWWNR